MRDPRRVRRPFPPPARRFVLVAALAALVAASCDTGDGKTLREPDEAATTTIAPPPTLLSVPLSTLDPAMTAAGESVPTDPPSDQPSVAPFQAFAPWQDGGPIDALNTCDGGDVSPAVSWASPPAGTSELAIAFVDETADDGDGPFVHWVVAGIDPASISLFEGEVPIGVAEATNSFGVVGYRGPCPPAGDATHVYRLTLYALNQQNELADGTPATELLEFIEDVAIGAADLTGTYRR
ncbi:MAG: YbhB/YbcL family Raf kinase inhibitor-like protein [Ilumatobacteraceae bacterium]